MKRREALGIILDRLSDELVVCCNGMISREAFSFKDRPQNFYMIGSMGLAAAIGLGLARSRPGRRVVVLDGDGNVLMNLGTLAEIGAFQPPNFLHICLDNGVYGSTGNQPTLSPLVDLSGVARSAGYAWTDRVPDRDTLSNRLAGWLDRQGPGFALVRVEVDAAYETAPRVSLDPVAIRDRFRSVVLEVHDDPAESRAS